MKLLSILTESIKEQLQLWPTGEKNPPTGYDWEKDEVLHGNKKITFGGSGALMIDPNTEELFNPSTILGSKFGPRSGGNHNGNDYKSPVGTYIVHLKKGVVIKSGNINPEGWGNMVEIKNEDGSVSRYAHLSEILVKDGIDIEPGTIIGATGGAVGSEGAGNSEGPHLHFEYLPSEGSSPVDPSDGGKDNATFKFLSASDKNNLEK